MTDADILASCRERIDAGDAQGAVLELQALLQGSPRNEDAWRLLAEGVAALGNRRLATEALETAARALGSPALALAAAWRWEEVGEAQKARDLLRHFVVHDAGDLALYRQLATWDLQEKRWQDANLCLEKALELAPDDEILYSDYVGTALLSDKAGRALSRWSRFRDRTRNDRLLSNMAVFFLNGGDPDGARQLLERAAGRHPNLFANLGHLAYRTGRFDEAARHLVEAERLGQEDSFLVGLCLWLCGQDREAKYRIDRIGPTALGLALGHLVGSATAGKLRAMLGAGKQPEISAWLEAMAALRREKSDAIGLFAALLLLEAWQYRFCHSRLPDPDFLCAAFPPDAFRRFVVAREIDFARILGLFFNAFAIGQRSQARDVPTAERLFEDYFLPAATDLLAARQWSRTLTLAGFSYFYVRTDPTPERFARWAKRLGDIFAPLPAGRSRRTTHGGIDPVRPLRIAYLTDHFMHDEAPDRVLYGLLTALKASGRAHPVVMACGQASETIRLQFAEAGVDLLVSPCNVATTHPDGVEQCRLWLAREMSRLGIEVAVFYGATPAFCALIAPFLPVKACIYDSVAHTGIALPCLDGYMRASRPVDARLFPVDGVDWWFYQNAHPASAPSLRQLTEAAHIRTAFFPGRIVLGAIARAVKLTDEFLDAVAAILKARPQAVFVWTDFLPEPQIVARLRERGIEEQCHYAGYVDHVVWAEVLDIHLDPFPFASGLTMRQSWHRGRAYAMMASRYRGLDGRERRSALGLTETSIEPLLALPHDHPARQRALEIFGPDLRHLAVADSVEGYVDWALRIIDDPVLRDAVGRAAQAYSDAFLTDMSEVAQTHLAGIRYFLERKTMRR